MAMKDIPCKDCGRRAVGCHSKCTDYAESRKQYEAARAEAINERRSDQEFHAYAALSRRRHLEEKRRKGK